MTVSSAALTTPPPAADIRGATIVPFGAFAQMRRRSAAPERRDDDRGETRGEILLFLGVRYERRAS